MAHTVGTDMALPFCRLSPPSFPLPGIDDRDLVDEELSEAVEAARTVERARCAAICAEGNRVGQQARALADHLTFATQLDPDQAAVILRSAPAPTSTNREAPSPTTNFYARFVGQRGHA